MLWTLPNVNLNDEKVYGVLLKNMQPMKPMKPKMLRLI